MGRAPELTLQRGECALVHTGGMLPRDADAVVMLEYTQPARPYEIEVLRAVAIDENVLKIGEDVSAGEVVIPACSFAPTRDWRADGVGNHCFACSQ